ncbi:MAG: hypothetical protein MJA83_08480, partial [Gammaproteobacteria bacterium]|nr:hypothetical protein [Gammaproteobacteria bacterium]
SNNGNLADLWLEDKDLRFQIPLGFKGNQLSPKMTAITWTLYWMMLQFAGFVPSQRKRSGRSSFPQLHLTLRPGTRSSAGTLIFNPRFTEWQMGWPKGWTSCGARVTGFARWLRLMRSELSRLPSIGGASRHETGGG